MGSNLDQTRHEDEGPYLRHVLKDSTDKWEAGRVIGGKAPFLCPLSSILYLPLSSLIKIKICPQERT